MMPAKFIYMANEHEMMTFTKKRKERLQAAYDKAVKNKQESFMFDGKEFVTAYAKYVLQYLSNNFK